MKLCHLCPYRWNWDHYVIWNNPGKWCHSYLESDEITSETECEIVSTRDWEEGEGKFNNGYSICCIGARNYSVLLNSRETWEKNVLYISEP